jgi:ssDNA-binding replication factor A large subunit
MKIRDLKPGMEGVNLEVTVLKLEKPRKVRTYTGIEHIILEGEVKDDTGRAPINFWNEKINEIDGIEVNARIRILNCFISSFKGILQINVGRGSEVINLGGGASAQ